MKQSGNLRQDVSYKVPDNRDNKQTWLHFLVSQNMN